MSEQPTINTGVIEEKFSGVKEDIKEIKEGQKEILKKMDKYMEVRIKDFKACEQHRLDLSNSIDTKMAPMKEDVEKNNNFRIYVLYYVGAVISVVTIATASYAGYYKYLV